MNEMKTIGIMILLMTVLGVAEADYKHPSEQVKLNTDSSSSCKSKCILSCIGLIPTPPLYSKCMQDCDKKCGKNK